MIRNQKAFTLLELSVVMVIVGIMVALAYPSILAWLQASESRRAEMMFKDMLRQARAEAYISKRDVMICTLNAQKECDRAGVGVLVMFYDENRNGKKDVNESVLFEQDWKLRYGQILLRVSAARHHIKYQGHSATPRGHFGHLRYCSESNNARLSFKVIVNGHGRVSLDRGDLVGMSGVGC